MGEAVLLATLRLFPAREQRRQLLALLRSVQGPTEVKPGCLVSRLYEEDGAKEAILYIENWASEEEFRLHVRSDDYLRILAAMELSKAAPEVCFHHVSSTESLALIEKFRARNGNNPLRGAGTSGKQAI